MYAEEMSYIKIMLHLISWVLCAFFYCCVGNVSRGGHCHSSLVTGWLWRLIAMSRQLGNIFRKLVGCFYLWDLPLRR